MIDLYSDTLTKPTPAMRQAMANAEVGDEQRREDPTTSRLQQRVAQMLGKEAAMFLPSGAMCNAIAIKTHTQPSDAILCERFAHIYRSEFGGPALLSGVTVEPIDGDGGIFTTEKLATTLGYFGGYGAKPRLLCLEQTHNFGGGTIWPLQQMRAVCAMARDRGLATHLDGARLWNASIASGVSLADYAANFDSVWVDFSKGLGCPVGAVLAGSKDFIERAWRFKHLLGGAMRQSGILAGACVYALDHHVERLCEDHENAKAFAKGLSAIDGIELLTPLPETNIVFFRLRSTKINHAEFVERTLQKGVRLGALATGLRAGDAFGYFTSRHSRRDRRDAIRSFVARVFNPCLRSEDAPVENPCYDSGMAENQMFDLIVIGAGPGGYVAAIRAAQLGMKVACVEREFLGGTCLNIGCIPSKALLDSSERYSSAKHQFSRHGINVGEVSVDLSKMMARKQDVVGKLTGGVGMLFRKNKIEHIKGQATIASPSVVQVRDVDGKTQSLQAKRILIATGSAPIEIPSLKFDGKNILSSTEALSLTEIPKKMVIVGGGYIGVEMGSVWNRLGTEVTTIEFLDRILPPSDTEMALGLQKLLEKQGIKFRFKTGAQGATINNGKVQLAWKANESGETGTEEVDKVLVCVGRRPITDGLGLDKVGVEMDKRGFITVGSHYETNVSGIYAIGDVIGGVMLAHKAEEEGVAAVELMAGKFGHVNYHCCPSVVYTHPELAQVGFSEEDARKEVGEIAIGKFPFSANGRARGMDETDGLVKIIADAKTDRVLGVHILGVHASDMIAQCVLAMEYHASSEDIARCFAAHPTLPEAVKEAALAVEKRAIHI